VLGFGLRACLPQVELLISILYYLKSVCQGNLSHLFFCGKFFAVFQRFKCRNENVFRLLFSLSFPSLFSSIFLLMASAAHSQCFLLLSLPTNYIYWPGDKFLLPSFSFALRLLHMALISCHLFQLQLHMLLLSSSLSYSKVLPSAGLIILPNDGVQASGYVMHFYQTFCTVRHGILMYSLTRFTAHNLTSDMGMCVCDSNCV